MRTEETAVEDECVVSVTITKDRLVHVEWELDLGRKQNSIASFCSMEPMIHGASLRTVLDCSKLGAVDTTRVRT
jgi:hypothetical protein